MGEASARLSDAATFLESFDCFTAFGNAAETVEALLAGKVALKEWPVYGDEAEACAERVPLALRDQFTHSVLPRWWADLKSFLAPMAGAPWGTVRYPLFFASSNYGIDGLYSLGKTREFRYSEMSTPHGCVRRLCAEMGWGARHFLFSHACVSGQLAIERASAAVAAGWAEKALVVTFDYVGPFVAAGFHALKILNGQLPAPYSDLEVGSIGLGDGVACCVISREESALRLGRQNTYNEMFHFTANEPEGSGFEAILAPYVEDLAGRRFWVKGHGTGTLEAGKLESRTLARIFPGAPLVSWKGALGHTLGSCAAVELAVAAAAVEGGRVPGTVVGRRPVFAENVCLEPFAAADFDGVLLLSNAFGGAHASLFLDYA